MAYEESRARLVQIGFFQRTGIPMPQFPLAVQFGGDSSFCVVSPLKLFFYVGCVRALVY